LIFGSSPLIPHPDSTIEETSKSKLALVEEGEEDFERGEEILRGVRSH
jgi:hypothetical protein